ncbi:MAG: hypothetical protein INQ03_10615 [Candidatus Heimdallarchaeota archaeon]|nr:hypothetical protein [Candidatus Heimdallarchaeota archaeon]
MDIYKRFSALMKSSGINIGDAMNRMMLELLESEHEKISSTILEDLIPSKPLEIAYHDTIEVNKQDLIKENKKIFFYSNKVIIFSKDITRDVFEKYVKEINQCKKIIIPNTLSKLYLLSITKKYDSIEWYEV